MLLLLGTKTIFGKVTGITMTEGERYYFMTDKHGVVSFMPATALEKAS